MQQRSFGRFGQASALTLGGGGIGQIWGSTDHDEAVATLRGAIDAGIDVLDTAPMYGRCEANIGVAFGGHVPAHVRITSKCGLGTPPRGEAASILAASLTASLQAMRLERIDLLFLHSNICADDYIYVNRPDLQDRSATRWSIYRDEVVPALEALCRGGRIGGWGITGVGVPDVIAKALAHSPQPAAVQIVANLLDSAGGMRRYAEPAEPRRLIAAANAAGVPVMGIRAVQAGALTSAIDRTLSTNQPEQRDFERAAPFRALCVELGVSPSLLAHRYALSMSGINTVVLGVKNRSELQECLQAEAQGALDAATIARIDGLGLRG